MSAIAGFLGKNSSPVNATEAQEELSKEYPQLLQPNESVVLAFVDRAGKGRDKYYFTSERIVIIDKHGLSGKKTDYISIPYNSIEAYQIETAGSADTDSELLVYASGYGKFSLDFVKGAFDILELQNHLNQVVLVEGPVVPSSSIASTKPSPAVGSSSGGNVFDWMGSNATQIDVKVMEPQLKESKVLMKDEIVELAFKCGRDSFLITSKRLLQIDVKGLSGKKVAYFSILWKCIRAFSVETGGNVLDRDSELLLYTIIPGRTRIALDFKKGRSDIFSIQSYISCKLLGMDTVEPTKVQSEPIKSGMTNLFSWLGNDSRMVDAKQMDQQYHSNPPILLDSETVEMAFKGRRDLVLFSNKRLILVDMKGWSAQKVEYLTVPWTTVQCFGVKTAGTLDKDSELMIWTDIDDTFFPPKEDDDDVQPRPIPRKSFLELDFQKDKVPLKAIHHYLSERCLGGSKGEESVEISLESLNIVPEEPSALKSFIGWLANDSHAVDPKQMDVQLHDANSPVLQDDEHVAMAFRGGRDTTVFTDKRILIMDTQGITGKKIAWITLPYTNLRAFACETAGGWADKDAELRLYCKIYWFADNLGNVIQCDFRHGQCDIYAIQKFLAAQILANQDGSSGLLDQGVVDQVTNTSGSLNFLSNDGIQINSETAAQELKPILLDDEAVDLAFKVHRDMTVFTTKRILLVDRKGLSGSKVEYTSYPLKFGSAFGVRAAGHLLSDAGTTVYMDTPGLDFQQDLKKKSSDIWAIQTMLATKLMTNKAE